MRPAALARAAAALGRQIAEGKGGGSAAEVLTGYISDTSADESSMDAAKEESISEKVFCYANLAFARAVSVPRIFAELKDAEVYDTARVKPLRVQCSTYVKRARGLLAAWHRVLELGGRAEPSIIEAAAQSAKGERKTVPNWFLPSFFALASHVCEGKTGWEATRAEASRAISALSMSMGLGAGGASTLVAAHGVRLLAWLRERVSKSLGGNLEADSHTYRVIEWCVARMVHPTLTDCFSATALPLVLRLVDHQSTEIKATGLRTLCHCVREVMRVQVRARAAIIINRLTQSLAYHEIHIERPLFDTVCSALPIVLSDPDLRSDVDGLAQALVKGCVREIEWLGFSVSDTRLDRVELFATRAAPGLIRAIGTGCAMHIRSLFSALARFAESDDERTAIGGLKGLEALVIALASRAPAHSEKFFELCCRVYIKNKASGPVAKHTEHAMMAVAQGCGQRKVMSLLNDAVTAVPQLQGLHAAVHRGIGERAGDAKSEIRLQTNGRVDACDVKKPNVS